MAFNHGYFILLRKIETEMSGSFLSESAMRLVSYCIGTLIPRGFSVALWRSPADEGSGFQGMVSALSRLSIGHWDASLPNPNSFVWAPFCSTLDNSYQYLTAEALWEEKKGQLSIHDPKELLKGFLSDEAPSARRIGVVSMDCSSTSRAFYRSAVQLALDAIQKGMLQKVVLAQTQWQASRPLLGLGDAFAALCSRYPRAFVYVFASPSVGIWIGASPERLLHYQNHQLRLQSLAATRAASLHRPWSKKEQLEQSLVSAHIATCVDALPPHTAHQTPPRSVHHGNIQHLQTDFEVRFSAAQPLSKLGDFLRALHPTPALCGTPRQQALQFIAQQEGFSREYYAGFLGPIQADKMDLYVNIRCGRCYENGIRLFAGAGIVAGSVPEKEWIETRQKCRAIGYLFAKGKSKDVSSSSV